MTPRTTTTDRRLAKLRETFDVAGINAFLVNQADNRRYLSGFTGSNGWLLITRDAARIATDSRYFEQVGLECPGFELVKYGSGGGGFSDEGLRALLAGTDVRRPGFEAEYATFADVESWQAHASYCEWVPTQGLVMALRATKDDGEIAAIRSAVALADEALAAALASVRPGMTEVDLAWALESYMRTHGAEGLAFETIVASGPNGARPHARAGSRVLHAGEPVVIDMGALLDGYCSDLTRTVCLGEPADTDRFWEVFNTVLRAQQAAEAAVRPGMTGREVDAVARDVIREAGYGDYFGHSLGHGVGLAVHEQPTFRTSNADPIEPGNVVTVEPGIYLPGWGGVRLEDIVLIVDDGAEVLTRAPKAPIIRVN